MMEIPADECGDSVSGQSDDEQEDSTLDTGEYGSNGEPAHKKKKLSRDLPVEAIAVFKNWMLSEKNFAHPYPSLQEQTHLLEVTGLNKRQLKNWFTNARRRIWKPLLQARLKGAGSEADVQPGELQDLNAALTSVLSSEGMVPGFAATGTGSISSLKHSISREKLVLSAGKLEAFEGSMAGSSDPQRTGRENSIVMSLTEFENPTRVHTFEVPPEIYLEESEEQTNINKNVIMDAVAVAANARCLMCTEDAVDMQAVPCQHLLHTRCLRKWMQSSEGQTSDIIATCPICSIGINQVVLAVPCVNNIAHSHRPRASTDMLLSQAKLKNDFAVGKDDARRPSV